MAIEPAIQIVIDQLFRPATSHPKTKPVDPSIRVAVEGGLLTGFVMPSDALRHCNRLPSIRPGVALASDYAEERTGNAKPDTDNAGLMCAVGTLASPGLQSGLEPIIAF
jgi:hypothetical protein